MDRLLQSRGGSAAVEMAMIAPIFLLMLLITIELGIMLYTQSVLDGAARIAAREIRTGQVQASSTPLTTFTTVFCNNVSIAVNCANVAIDVESFATFSSMSLNPVQVNKKGQVTNNAFTPGSPGSAVAVRVFYTYNFFVPWVSLILNPNGNGVVLEATVVFENEPYPTTVSG
jgi:Flp pilus assembly protein TadG